MDIGKSVDASQEEMLRLLSGLIEKKTENPPGNEYLAAGIVEKFFRKYGIPYKTFEKTKGRTNIVGYIGKGSPSIIIPCHLDTVPAGEGWKADPFKARVEGDLVYGRGAHDNKGPLAATLITAKILKEMERSIEGTVLIAAVADEEQGSAQGMKFLLDENKVKADYAVVPDIGRNLEKIDVAEKGALFLKLTAIGKQAHGSRPEEGINAIEVMIDFLGLFRKYEMRYNEQPLFTGPTKNIGKISGGIAPNVVAGSCEALVDMRYLPNQKKGEILKDIDSMISNALKKHPNAGLVYEIVTDLSPHETRADNALVASIKKNAKKVTGKEPGIFGMSGVTVAKQLAERGVIAVGYGPGDEGKAHSANESVPISQLLDFSKILILIILDIMRKT